MYILEYVTEWDDGEKVLNRFECENYTDVQTLVKQAKYSPCESSDGGCPTHLNYDFRIEEVS